MHTLYPMKFNPVMQEKVWGGKKLKKLLGKDYDPLPNCGESWEISGMPGNVSVVRNGFLEGNELPELVEVYMGEVVGEGVFDRFGSTFPLLVKFLDTDDDLSIQVHPGDAMAMERHHGRGKAEMWYVVDAAPGAEIMLGFREDVTPGLFREKLTDKSLKELLNVYSARSGDVFHIPTGQVHAIGKGITLCEIQQASDITYRIYDWDRPGIDGNPRKLHLEEAMEAIDFSPRDGQVGYEVVKNVPVELVNSPEFTTRLLAFDRKINQEYVFVDSFVIYVCLKGRFSINYAGGSVKAAAGECLLIPAEINNLSLDPEGSCQILETYIVT